MNNDCTPAKFSQYRTWRRGSGFVGGLLIGLLANHATAEPASQFVKCSQSLDRGLAVHASGARTSVLPLMQQLKNQCPGLPQIEHNLGVLAAERADWDAAVAHFEKALAMDARATSTSNQLASIHRYRAQVAYARALNTERPATTPTFAMQGSDFNDSTNPANLLDADHAAQTSHIEYELYEWWQAAKREQHDSWRRHYAKDYEPLSELRAIRQVWDQIGRQIHFTAKDAVVILAVPKDDDWTRYLLLMRREQQRWIIYQETPL